MNIIQAVKRAWNGMVNSVDKEPTDAKILAELRRSITKELNAPIVEPDGFVNVWGAPPQQSPELWLAMRDNLLAELESLRRERHSVGATPLPDFVDYAPAAQAISQAMMALDEGIPNGQRRRVEVAFLILREGSMRLEAWLKEKGYRV